MNSNLHDLQENFFEKVSGLGINSKFMENPAYASVLGQIGELISEMHVEDAEKVYVDEEEGKISFKFVSPDRTNYSMSISANGENTITCFRTIEEKFGDVNRQKEFVEMVATLDDSTGSIELVTNGAMVDNAAKEGSSNCYNWAEKASYTPYGIMQKREYKNFNRAEKNMHFDSITSNNALTESKNAFNIGNSYYSTRTLLTREKLDVARIHFEDKKAGLEYSSMVELNREHGLRNMVLPGGDPMPEEVIIPPISVMEIDKMIESEHNPKVEQGLREYAKDREMFYYNSNEDKGFIRKVFSQSNEAHK